MAIANAFNSRGGSASINISGDGGRIKTVPFVNLTTITITHNFDTFPNVIVIDSNGEMIHASVQYQNNNQILINFSNSLSGTVVIR